MNVLKLMACTVLLLTSNTGPTLASMRVTDMETLLRKPFWQPLISGSSNAQIRYPEQQSVRVGELFESCDTYDGRIVNEFNVNDKVRQYYSLLSIMCSNALYNYLNYFRGLIIKHKAGPLECSVGNHLIKAIKRCRKVFDMMDGALRIVRFFYVAEATGESEEEEDEEEEEEEEEDREEEDGIDHGDATLFGLDRERHLEFLKRVTDPMDARLYALLDVIWTMSEQTLRRNVNIVRFTSIVNATNTIQNHLDELMTVEDCTQRIDWSKSFLDNLNQRVLDKFEQIGFQYSVMTRSTILIQE